MELGPQIPGLNLAEPPRFPFVKDGCKGTADARSEPTKERARDWTMKGPRGGGLGSEQGESTEGFADGRASLDSYFTWIFETTDQSGGGEHARSPFS